MFAGVPVGTFAILQFPDLQSLGRRLYPDPEVALVANEPRRTAVADEGKRMYVLFEPRRMEIGEFAPLTPENPRKRTR